CTVSAVSWSSPVLCPQSLSSPVLCPQSWVISCTVSAFSGHLLYCDPQSLVISCTVSASLLVISLLLCHAVSGHLLYCVPQSLWSSPVLRVRSLLVISVPVSA
ncbi:unnamed protein product, partial [Staurois parvus]